MNSIRPVSGKYKLPYCRNPWKILMKSWWNFQHWYFYYGCGAREQAVRKSAGIFGLSPTAEITLKTPRVHGPRERGAIF